MKRSKFEQAVDILSNAVQPIVKTTLHRKANLSFYQSQPLFEFLEEKGYLGRVESPPLTYRRGKARKVKFLYLTTKKGLKALELFRTPPLKGLLDCYEWIQEQKEVER